MPDLLEPPRPPSKGAPSAARVALQVATNDLRLLLRDPPAVVLALLWPLALAIFVGAFAPGLPGRGEDGPSGLTPFALSFPQGVVWGVISCAATFGIGVVQERDAGTLARLQLVPVPPVVVLVGKALACLTASLVVAALLLTVGAVGFGLRPASWARLAAATFALAMSLCGLATLVATLAPTARSASGLSWAVLMTLAALGGAILPLETLPSPARQAALASPVAWGILALEGATWRAWSWGELAAPIVAQLTLGCLALALGGRRLRPRC